jgi:hypothetical protein
MKKIAFIFSIFLYGIVLGQVPQKLSYQAVIRDASNNIVSNQPVGIRISIIQGSPTGTPVYIETHNPMTNTDGLVSIEIAGGVVVSGTFSVIDWSKTPYFLFTEVDPTGGVSYSIFSTTELMSVPFALFAEKSRNPGPAGPQGVQGPAGVNGANGVGINNAQVINDSLKLTLTNGNAINAGYVKGTKGDTGIQGPVGVNGTNGISITNTQVINDSLKVTLSDGTTITAGYVKGAKGDTGVQGLQGIQGQTGSQGSQGVQGPAGTNGISITNTQVINDSLKVTLSDGTTITAGYVKGAKGDTGVQGIQGVQGPAGTNGISVTNTQVVNDTLKVTLSNGNIINSGSLNFNNGGFMIYNQPGIYNFTVPLGVTRIIVEAWGAGGGGALGYQPSGTGVKYMGGGGGSGSYGKNFLQVVSGQTYFVTVGSGGIGGSNLNCGGQYECGGNGGSSSFGNLLIANGGGGSCGPGGGGGGTCNSLIYQNGNNGGNGTTHMANGTIGTGGLNVGPNTNFGRGGNGSFCALPWQYSAQSGQNGLVVLYW